MLVSLCIQSRNQLLRRLVCFRAGFHNLLCLTESLLPQRQRVFLVPAPSLSYGNWESGYLLRRTTRGKHRGYFSASPLQSYQVMLRQFSSQADSHPPKIKSSLLSCMNKICIFRLHSLFTPKFILEFI